ncbi:MAG TPA: VOC family protein [Anaerolineales bacterium]|nr:VOC family protein [Anaerolineales bacterium]
MMKFRRLTAELVTEDIPGTIEYYTNTLGLELDAVFPKDASIPQWVQFKCSDDYLMFESRKSLGQVIPEIQWLKLGGSFDIFIEMEGVAEYYERIKDKVQVIVKLTEIPFRQFAIKDINGYILLFGQLD